MDSWMKIDLSKIEWVEEQECRECYVYFITTVGHPFCKIGMADSPWHRRDGMQVGCPLELEIAALVRCDTRDDAACLEGQLHERFAHLRERGEWFRLEGPLSDHLNGLGQ